MLRVSLLSLALFGFVNAFAEVPKQVQEIRKAYANAQKPSSYSITLEKNRNYCAVGVSKRKVEFLFDEQKNLTLIKEGFNRSAQKYYYEYLFNKNQPYFFYRKEDTYDGKVEERLYFLGSNSFYSLPEGIRKTEQELSAIKAGFENYLNLVAQVKAYQEKEYDNADVANLEAKFIKPEEGENNAEIKAINERGKGLEKLVEQGKEETHLDNKVVITIKNKEDKEQLKFYFTTTEKCGEIPTNQLNLVKIEKFNTSEEADIEADMGENFVFDEKGNLQKSYSWESHEGSEGILYFLNNDKIYCLGDVREMKEDGTGEQYPLPCNSPKIKEKNLMFFGGGNYNAQKESQQLKKLFEILENSVNSD